MGGLEVSSAYAHSPESHRKYDNTNFDNSPKMNMSSEDMAIAYCTLLTPQLNGNVNDVHVVCYKLRPWIFMTCMSLYFIDIKGEQIYKASIHCDYIICPIVLYGRTTMTV